MDSRALLSRILTVLGVASLEGCGGRDSDDGDEAAAGSGSEAESESESSMGSTSSMDDTPDDADSHEPKLDTPPLNSEGDDSDDSGSGSESEGVDCSGLITEQDIEYEWVPPIQCLPWRVGTTWENVCFYPPDGVTCESRPIPDVCLVDAFDCGGEEVACGPFTTDSGACCYVVWGEGCPPGRPWIVEGRARLAALEPVGHWMSPIAVELSELDAETRTALADVWASEGLAEHASVASFTRFTLQLLALGAPSALVEASIRAGLDEVRHARIAFAFASAYAGSPVGPGSLDVRGGLDEPLDRDSIALSLAAEGCIAETVSAILLAAARDRARNPAVRAALAAIVADEIEHALLAWEALAWMCRRGQSVAGLAAVFDHAERCVAFGATTELPGHPVLMREHGYLSVEERREVAARALADVVAPAARELFASLEASTIAMLTA